MDYEPDPTEARRRAMVQQINSGPLDRASLEEKYGQLWDTDQLAKDFVVEAFLSPFVFVTRKADGKKGVLMFSHSPRHYFAFESLGE